MKRNNLYSLIILCNLLIFSNPSTNAREVISIDKNWTFSNGIQLRGGFGRGFGRSTADTVNLPHTWNSADFMSEDGYRRGYGSYNKNLDIPKEYEGKRIFLRFDGAGSVANVFVNSNHIGEHKGAYNSFTYEITDVVNYGGRNNISVICDNSQRFDVAPQGGDFNMYGGLYRDAWLIVADDDACISPLYYGSSGVFIHQLVVSDKRAELRAEIYLSTKSDYKNCEIEFTILDADNNVISTQSNPYINNDKAICDAGIDNPHLWNGVEDPYLYKIVTVLKRNGKEIDRVEENTGFRTFYVDPDKGFFLNGKHLKLRGVCRHQDWAGIASALTKENHLVDYSFFEEMGVNALRLAHYPQAHFMFQEADRQGYVVWEEIPFVGGYIKSKAFEDNLKLQLKELILQNYNHPSICFWGLFNEIRGDFDAITAELNELAHRLDPSRLTVAASYQEGTFNFITDAIAMNKYFGWYYDKLEDFGTYFDTWHAEHPHSKIGLSEYGAGASITQHVSQFVPEENPRPSSRGPWHPEEKQTAYHISHIKMIAERDFIWGTYVWNMFDFGSNFRHEGNTPHINDKGLVTYDRKQRKDAFYLYKANWNKNEKTTHLCSKNFTDRKEDVTDVVVFTTAPSAKLFINGKQIGKMNTDDYATVIWKNVKLNQGKNLVEIKTSDGSDSAEWTVE
ncbi:MAG TPA: glycoside hydrolase family 2 TIM barrel-domain containing protein [Draconibacterium sp.]|nr:glycoside hydrolase family 2 TIM barrel-domain containing protein [Draconibacterium sp.]